MLSTLVTLVVAFLALAENVVGRTITVNGIPFYPSSDVIATLSLSASQKDACKNLDLIPLTVVDGGKAAFGISELQSIVKTFTTSDDVFNTGFLQGMNFFSPVMYILN